MERSGSNTRERFRHRVASLSWRAGTARSERLLADVGPDLPRRIASPARESAPARHWLALRLSPRSLFWRVFIVNASLVTAAAVFLAVSPLTVSNPATPRQLTFLAVGLVLLLVANLLLLEVSLRPLKRLRHLMQRIDLLRPGDRLDVSGARELNVVLRAFNEMLERLERERRMSSSLSVGRDEEERRRLATELHDQIGQGLTALLLQLKTAMNEAPEQLRADLVAAREIARENLDELRRITRSLRPSLLDDLGLPYALLSLADAIEEQGDFRVVRRVDTAAPQVTAAAELALYRIAQEALTNAIRHAEADRIELVYEVSLDGQRVHLGIHDDGRGMIYASDVEAGGIRGMRERALAIDGHLSIATRPGGGTSVTLSVPAAR
jgi:two-component system, NarL family, sensor histidine kinase UhpB